MTAAGEAPALEARNLRIGVLLQSGNLIQHLDLRGNVRVAQLAVTHSAEVARMADRVLPLTDGQLSA